MQDSPKVGFIGVGNQGAPIARRIIDAGYEVTLWARRPEALAPFADTPARIAPTVAALGAACEVVGVCVFADADVDEVVAGPGGLLGAMRPGGVILIHSTAHPDLCRRLADQGAAIGVTVLDAPVSGGPVRAAAGEMAVMVGGPRDAYDRAAPILRTFASAVERLGPVGSGQVCKLLNNAVMTINLAGAFGCLETGEALGLDRSALLRMLTAGSGQSFALEEVGARTGRDRFRITEPRLRKDVSLALELLAEAGVRDDVWAELTVRAFETFATYAARDRAGAP